MKQKYRVRQFPVHKPIINGKGQRGTQIYNQGDEVELTLEEAKQFQHLIEPISKEPASKETKTK